MPTIHLGVIDLPYNEAPSARRAPKASKHPRPHKSQAAKYGNMTTGDVAEILEAKYHVMEIYWSLHEAQIAADLEESLSGALETILMGGPAQAHGFEGALSKIEDGFKQMLSQRELDGLGYPGIPTKAAQAGVSSRFKSGYTKNRTPRPSFVDTSLYMSSFRAWAS